MATVLVLGRPSPDPLDVGEAVRLLADAGARTTVLAHRDLDVPDATAVVVGGAGAVRTRRRRDVVGLVLDTLLRRTPGAVLARGALRRAEVRALLAGADVLVAGDPDAIETVWRAARRLARPDADAVNGVPAALRAVRGRRTT